MRLGPRPLYSFLCTPGESPGSASTGKGKRQEANTTDAHAADGHVEHSTLGAVIVPLSSSTNSGGGGIATSTSAASAPSRAPVAEVRKNHNKARGWYLRAAALGFDAAAVALALSSLSSLSGTGTA